MCRPECSALFFFNDTATTEIYTLSLHDALPISSSGDRSSSVGSASTRRKRSSICPVKTRLRRRAFNLSQRSSRDRKSTRLNSSHGYISYAVFCLKKKHKVAHYTSPSTNMCSSSY